MLKKFEKNRIVQNIPLDKQIGGNRTLSFQFHNGTGKIQIKDGKVRMLPMPQSICPKGICSDIGWISKPLQVIACAPNYILVSIEGSAPSSSNNIDIIAQ